MVREIERHQKHKTDGCDKLNANEEEEKEVVSGNEKLANLSSTLRGVRQGDGCSESG